MNKKLTYGLGAIMASAIPIVSVISCGSDDDWSIDGFDKQISSKLADAVKNGTDMPAPAGYPDVKTPADWKVEIKIVTDGLTWVPKDDQNLRWVTHFKDWVPGMFISKLEINTKTLIVYRDMSTATIGTGHLSYLAEEFNEAGIKEIFSSGKAEGNLSGIDYTKVKDFLLSNYSKLNQN